jgi:trimeric autotransporter adhesin
MSKHRLIVAALLGASVWGITSVAQEAAKAIPNAGQPKTYPVLPPADDSGLGYELLPSNKPKFMNIWMKDTGFWRLGGNTGTTPATNFLGTTDDEPLEIRVNGARVMRYEPNATSPNVVGGYNGNTVTAGVIGAVVAGGGQNGSANSVADNFGAVGGGAKNSAGGGTGATSRIFATVGGGAGNISSGGWSTIGGGANNVASRDCSTVGGGSGNRTLGWMATVGGGYINTAGGDFSTVAGGDGNSSSGFRATVPGGLWNYANGAHSFAAGQRAKANNAGVFAWADSSDTDFDVSADNRFAARASGGVYFYTKGDLSTGAYLAANSGTWTDLSDRNSKEHVGSIDSREVLRKVSAMPVTSWRYKGENASVSHVGPMAQDFHAAFGLGDSDKGITTIDADGIAFAAIQGLNEVIKEKDARISALETRLNALEAEVMKARR